MGSSYIIRIEMEHFMFEKTYQDRMDKFLGWNIAIDVDRVVPVVNTYNGYSDGWVTEITLH